MNDKIKNALVPKLRFPEFREAGEWKEINIGYFFNFYRKAVRSDSFDKEKVITVKLHTQGVVRNERTTSLTGGANYFKRRAGEFIFSKIDLLNGAFGIVPNELDGYVSSTDVPAFSFIDNCEPIFFINWLSLNYSNLKVERTGTSNTLKRVAPEKFFDLLMPTPIDINEQQKIAATLTALDDLISAQQEKINALQRHKKGLMQQLFPAEGERVPRVRFGEFEGEWEERMLGEVAEVITGSTPDTSEINNYGGNRMFVSPADIGDGRYVSRTKTTLTEMGYLQTRHVKENSVLFVCIGSTIGKIAQNKYECATNQQINSVVPYQGYSNEFLYSVLDHNATNIATLAGKQAVPIINKSLFSSVKLKFPPTKLEQQKIAAILTSLDDLLAAEGQRLAALRVWKQGLMQGMFVGGG